MQHDLLFREEDFVFSCRAAAVIVQDGKALMQRLQGEEGYAFIGGHVSAGETCAQALRREIREELHTTAEVGRLLALGEVFIPWGKKPCHQLALYYTVALDENALPGEGAFPAWDELEGQHMALTFEWVPLAQLAQAAVYPPQVVAWVLDPDKPTGHFVYSELPEGAFGPGEGAC